MPQLYSKKEIRNKTAREAIIVLETEMLLPWPTEIMKGLKAAVTAIHDHYDISREDIHLQYLRDRRKGRESLNG